MPTPLRWQPHPRFTAPLRYTFGYMLTDSGKRRLDQAAEMLAGADRLRRGKGSEADRRAVLKYVKFWRASFDDSPEGQAIRRAWGPAAIATELELDGLQVHSFQRVAKDPGGLIQPTGEQLAQAAYHHVRGLVLRWSAGHIRLDVRPGGRVEAVPSDEAGEAVWQLAELLAGRPSAPTPPKCHGCGLPILDAKHGDRRFHSGSTCSARFRRARARADRKAEELALQ